MNYSLGNHHFCNSFTLLQTAYLFWHRVCFRPSNRNWTDVDTTLLLEALLGSESTYFNTLIVNAKRAYKKVTWNYNLQLHTDYISLCRLQVASEVFGDQQRNSQLRVNHRKWRRRSRCGDT